MQIKGGVSRMTESEAIKEIRFNMSTIGLGNEAAKRVVEARDMAINAFEKQIPKKPMISYDERVKENWCSCGVCAFGLGWKRTIHYKYCPDCGQKIDWSDEE